MQVIIIMVIIMVIIIIIIIIIVIISIIIASIIIKTHNAQAMIPGMGLKFLRDSTDSANLLAMESVMKTIYQLPCPLMMRLFCTRAMMVMNTFVQGARPAILELLQIQL